MAFSDAEDKQASSVSMIDEHMGECRQSCMHTLGSQECFNSCMRPWFEEVRQGTEHAFADAKKQAFFALQLHSENEALADDVSNATGQCPAVTEAGISAALENTAGCLPPMTADSQLGKPTKPPLYGVLCGAEVHKYHLEHGIEQFCYSIVGLSHTFDGSGCRVQIDMSMLAQLHKNVFCKSDHTPDTSRYVSLRIDEYNQRDPVYVWSWELDGIEYHGKLARPIGIALAERLQLSGPAVRGTVIRALTGMFDETWEAISEQSLPTTPSVLWDQCLPYEEDE